MSYFNNYMKMNFYYLKMIFEVDSMLLTVRNKILTQFSFGVLVVLAPGFPGFCVAIPQPLILLPGSWE